MNIERVFEIYERVSRFSSEFDGEGSYELFEVKYVNQIINSLPKGSGYVVCSEEGKPYKVLHVKDVLDICRLYIKNIHDTAEQKYNEIK